MNNKTGRNDPCPCGSGKKYKNCCLAKNKPSTGPKKFSAKMLSAPKAVNLMERTYGNAIQAAQKEERPSTPPPEKASENQS